jgi:hypothetical protein
MPMKIIKIILISFLIITFSACTNSSSDDVNFGGGGGSSGSTISGDFRTNCGTVVGNSLRNPPSTGDGVEVRVVNAAGNNTVIVERDGGRQLIKLRALSSSVNSVTSSRAISIIDRFSGPAILFTNNCAITTAGGGQGVVGEIFNLRGESLTESLINQRAAIIDGTGNCQESLVAGCYNALLDTSRPPEGAVVSNFLWKPQAERDNNLVVLLNPGNATIVVNGETLAPSGPSNGRGTTARGNRPGGAYGSNIRLEAFDSSGRALIFPGNQSFFIIENGSQRVQF